MLTYFRLCRPMLTNAEVHDHNTRASTDLHVLGPRSTFGQRYIRYKGSMLWNRLPAID